jgi:hypothetical protein
MSQIILTDHGSSTPAASATITKSAVVAVTGSTLLVAVTGYDSTNGLNTHVTSVTYGGTALTQVDGNYGSSGAGASNYSFILQNCTAGTANIVVTFTASISNPAMEYAVFSGAATSGGPDAHNMIASTSTSAATPGSLSVTTVAANAVVWGWAGFNSNSGGLIAGSNQTQLDQFAGSYGVAGYTTTPVATPGSVTMQYSNGTTDLVGIFVISLAPSGTSSPIPATPVTSTTGNSASGTVATLTLPAYVLTDYLLLMIGSNNANAFTFSSGVTATLIASNGNRLNAYKIVPTTNTQTTFTATVATSSVIEWWIGNYRGADLNATVYSNTNPIGNSTVSGVVVPTTSFNYVATGNELAISAANVNATATWTTDGNTIFHTTANNAAMMIDAFNTTAGSLATAFAAMDRGSSGSSRNQNALSLVLQPYGNNATLNLLANASFEAGSTIATGWSDEHTTATQATYSLVTSPLTDGSKAQQFSYTGVTADAGTAKTEIYQSPVTGMSPGDVLTFSMYLSGTMTGLYGFIGIEGFLSGGTYISESDTNFTTLTGTPTLYTVSYTCPPSTSYVAVYLQVPSLGTGTSITVTMDKAILTRAAGTAASTGQFFALF